MNKLIETIDLTKVYGEKETSVTALNSINTSFKENQFTAIMGPSGSGKSTLLHCLAGLDKVTGGSILINGVDLASLNCELFGTELQLFVFKGVTASVNMSFL